MNQRMSTKRFTPKPHADKGKCRWCGKDVPKGRKSWCGQECVNQYLMRSSAAHVRAMIKQRDHGICAICGIDADAEYRKWISSVQEISRMADRLATASRWNLDAAGHFENTQYPDGKSVRNFREYLKAKYAPGNWTPGRRSGWDADHIVPVSEGGGECDLSNYRTLCHPCHKKVTKELAARLSAKRKEPTGPKDQQMMIFGNDS